MFSAPALFTWNLRALRQLGGGSRKAQGENSSVGFRVLGLVDFLVNGASLEAQRNRVKGAACDRDHFSPPETHAVNPKDSRTKALNKPFLRASKTP